MLRRNFELGKVMEFCPTVIATTSGPGTRSLIATSM